MRKNVWIAALAALFVFSPVSSQSILKKLGDAAKKVTATEQNNQSQQSSDPDAPLTIKIETTRIIGDQLLISGKMQLTQDARIMHIRATAITPDGDLYEGKSMYWGGDQSSTLSAPSFDEKLTSGIAYNFDLCFETQGKAITEIGSLTLNMFNHTSQKTFKIVLKNLSVPAPADPNLENPSAVEISKGIYLRWTKAVEAGNGLEISFVVENKGTKDQDIRFPFGKAAKIIDSDGNSYEADITLKDKINFPAGTPVAGKLTLDKPLKVSQIALFEFNSQHYKYKIRKIVLPAN